MNNFLLFFNISGGEILIIVLVVYLIFGPKKIPELARMVGKGVNELRRATQDIRDEITKETNKIKKEVNINVDDPFQTKKASQNSTKDNKAKNVKEESDKGEEKKPTNSPKG